MATGLTIIIEEGATFPQFLWRCARQMGAFIEMRDEPYDASIPIDFKPSTHHAVYLRDVIDQINRLEDMSALEQELACKEDYAMAMKAWSDSVAKRDILRDKYEAMRQQVEAWQPPTPQHEGLKVLMLRQIQDSIEFDCRGMEAYKPKKFSIRQWYSERHESLLRSKQYHQEGVNTAEKEAKERTEWVQALARSVPVAIWKG